MIAIVDYGAGNLRSVQKALERLGFESHLTSDPEVVVKARGVILPGVGSASGIMKGLRRLNLVDPIKDVIDRGIPFLGVCMGLQVLFSESEEGDGEQCLNILPGRVRRLPMGLKVPHMGWNTVRQSSQHPLWDGIASDSFFYFVHSFFVDPEDRSVVIGETEYGIPFTSAVASGKLMGTQFHPEKSGALGVRIYENFARLVRDGFPSNTGC
ncbi:MAG: imidazole glycerol phosphate synthase subunit HisH [Chloroflexota bacterium]